MPASIESTISRWSTLSVTERLSARETPLFVTSIWNELALPPEVTTGSANFFVTASRTSLTIATWSVASTGAVVSSALAYAAFETDASASVVVSTL